MLREADSGVKDQRDIIKQPGVWAAVVVGAGGQSIDTTNIENLGGYIWLLLMVFVL